MLTRIKKREDAPFQLLPLQQKYLVDSIEDVRGYSMAYDKSDWADKIDEVHKWQALLLRELGLTDRMENQRIEIDYLVRQFYGSPGAREGQKNFVEPVTATDYIEAVRLMLAFVKDGRNPLEAPRSRSPRDPVAQDLRGRQVVPAPRPRQTDAVRGRLGGVRLRAVRSGPAVRADRRHALPPADGRLHALVHRHDPLRWPACPCRATTN